MTHALMYPSFVTVVLVKPRWVRVLPGNQLPIRGRQLRYHRRSRKSYSSRSHRPGRGDSASVLSSFPAEPWPTPWDPDRLLAPFLLTKHIGDPALPGQSEGRGRGRDPQS